MLAWLLNLGFGASPPALPPAPTSKTEEILYAGIDSEITIQSIDSQILLSATDSEVLYNG